MGLMMIGESVSGMVMIFDGAGVVWEVAFNVEAGVGVGVEAVLMGWWTRCFGGATAMGVADVEELDFLDWRLFLVGFNEGSLETMEGVALKVATVLEA
jgi:hypothetical protein